MKKKILLSSPVLLAVAAVLGINQYRQSKKMKSYLATVKENTKVVRKALILGDSVAKGYGSTNGGITSFLKEHLDQQFGDVMISNEGVLHLTSQGLTHQLIEQKKFDRQLKDANLVFINIGGNDLLQYYYKDGPRGLIKNFFKIRSSYIKNLEKIVRYIERMNPSIVIVVNNLYNSLEKNYQYYGFTEFFINLWNQSMRKLPVIRIKTKEMNWKKDLWADMVHPNEAGYEELSSLIIEQLRSVTEEQKTSKVKQENTSPLRSN